MPEIDSFDRLIDSALATYADSGADPELAQRVLARISAEAAPAARHRWLPWAIALPVAAGLLVLIMLYGSKPMHRVANRANQAQVSQPPHNAVPRAEPSVIAHSTAVQHVKVSRPQPQPHAAAAVIKSKPLPKLDIFPTPQPLTPAEQVLVTFAAHAPDAERQALVKAQKQIDKPLSIAAIEIQPLAPPEIDRN